LYLSQRKAKETAVNTTTKARAEYPSTRFIVTCSTPVLPKRAP
jgi:hypothetical protein